jgi:hypothetical protein
MILHKILKVVIWPVLESLGGGIYRLIGWGLRNPLPIGWGDVDFFLFWIESHAAFLLWILCMQSSFQGKIQISMAMSR